MKIEHFNRKTCGLVGQDALDALQAVAEKHGLTVKRGRGSFEDATFGIKFTFDVEGAEPVMVRDFRQWHSIYGLPLDALGKTFEYGTKTFVFVGLKPSNRRYPIIGRGTNGKQYKFPDGAVSAFKTVEASTDARKALNDAIDLHVPAEGR